MGVLNNSMWNVASGASNFYEHQIAKSVRMTAPSSTSSSNGRLTRTVGTVDSNVHFTLNFWIKRNAIGGTNPVGSARLLNLFTPRNGTSGSVLHEFGFSATGSYGAGDAFVITNTNTGAYILSTNNLFRDTSAWYNIHIAADLDNGTAGEKLKIFVNGTEASYNVDNRSSYSSMAGMVAGAWTIGDYYNYGYPIQSYLAQFTFIDGTTYAASDFGETKNGVWIPKDPSGLTFGSEGYLLNFEASGDLGNDSSGNNNDWTSANLSAHDQVIDSPTFGSSSSGNFPLWTPLVKGATNLSEGNTRMDGTTNERSAVTSFHVPIGSKWYVECLVKQATNYNIVFGLVNPYQDIATYLEDQSTVNGMIFHGYSNGDWRTNPLVNGSRQGFNALSDDSTSARVLAMTINRVDNEIKMYIDNALITNGTISISATEDYTIFASMGGGANAAIHMNINCGHDSSGAGDFTAGSATDENGFGNFQHAPPSGFLAICSANMPTATSIDPAETDDNFPQKLFKAVPYTGNDGGTSNNVTFGFKPDLVMLKMRGNTGGGYPTSLWDTTRGDDYYLYPSETAASVTSGTDYVEFTSTGVKLDTNWDGINHNTETYIAHGWRANGGTTATNSNGQITSTVQVDPTGSFSIATYTGESATRTVGHGLSSDPEMLWIKTTGSTANWAIYQKGNAYNTVSFNRNNANDTGSSTLWGGGTAPTATVFSVGDGSETGKSVAYIAYCFSNLDGYIKSGVYEGNGNADGTFVYTGFSPAYVWCKSVDSTSDWFVFDNKRLGYNVDNNAVTLNGTAAATTTDMIDLLSNGFKLRIATDPNVAETFMYFAVAHNPFKYATAR